MLMSYIATACISPANPVIIGDGAFIITFITTTEEFEW